MLRYARCHHELSLALHQLDEQPRALLEDLMVLGRSVTASAAEGEVIFRARVPSAPEDLQKLWREFLTSYAKALKAKHDLPIAVEDKAEWVELRVRTA